MRKKRERRVKTDQQTDIWIKESKRRRRNATSTQTKAFHMQKVSIEIPDIS